MLRVAGIAFFAMVLTSVPGEGNVEKDIFGKTADGKIVERYTLTNKNGSLARVITYGATLTELLVQDREGNLGDVVLGFDTLEQYEKESPYFGCTTGRVANRIAKGRFALDGVEYRLAVNNGPNHLHGGLKGFDKVVWKAAPLQRAEGAAVRFAYLSRDGEEGYPGNLEVVVTYLLTDDDELRLEYQATTDRATPVNLTNHSYFNLAGKGDVLGHILTLYARYYTEPDETLIPTGRILPVAGTPLDFIRPAAVGGRIGRIAIGGYDHNYVLDNGGRAEPGLAAELYDPASGRVMELYTTEPAVQLYSGIHLKELPGKKGAVYNQYYGLCLETQHYPDSINQPGFPSVVLRPAEVYRTATVHRFSTR
jgi:aldose 1-epimerase